MLRNYPIKTAVGFIVWFAAITVACIITFPMVRIFAYTSLIFFGVIQGWSVRETYMQELERRKVNPFSLSSKESPYASDMNLSESRSKYVRIAVYVLLLVALGLGSWAAACEGVSIQFIISLAAVLGIFVAFRFDRAHELQTAREICSGCSVIYLFFILMLPLNFNMNIAAACIIAAAIYISAIGASITPQKMPKLTLEDFKKMKSMGGKHALQPEKAFEWYDVYPYIAVAYRKGHKLLGYINLFPLKNEAASKLEKGNLKNADLDIGDIGSLAVINPSDKKTLSLSFISVIEECRDTGVADALIYEALMQYEDYFDCFDKVCMDTVTEDGEKLAERYGFSLLTETDHESKVYEIDFESFKNKVL